MTIASVRVAAGRAVVEAPAVALVDKVIRVAERDVVVACAVLGDVCGRITSVSDAA